MLTVQPPIGNLLRAVDAKSRQQAARFFISHSQFPRFLYKFNRGSLQAMEGFILNSTAYLSSPRQFNDPFDLRAFVELRGSFADQVQYLARSMRRRLPEAANRPGDTTAKAAALMNSGEYLTIMQKTFDEAADGFGVACFAASGPSSRQSAPRDILMWSHYAREHQGICFQFHTRRSPGFFSQAQRVQYANELIRINWADRVGRGDKIYAALFQKAKAWEHENEFRIALPERARTVEGFKEQALVGIILGCRAPDELAQSVVDLCSARYRAADSTIRLYRCVQKRDSYGLRIARAHDLEALARPQP